MHFSCLKIYCLGDHRIIMVFSTEAEHDWIANEKKKNGNLFRLKHFEWVSNYHDFMFILQLGDKSHKIKRFFLYWHLVIENLLYHAMSVELLMSCTFCSKY